MNQEKYSYEEESVELLDEEKTLLLLNDDVNTFDYVIEVLMKVCHQTDCAGVGLLPQKDCGYCQHE